MVVQTSTHIAGLMLLLALPPLLVGLVLVKAGYFGRRRGDTPHCRKCNYRLTGLSSERCPECGQPLGEERSVVHGERVRRPILGAVGCLLLAAASAAIIVGRERIDWYRYKPTAWVIEDAGDPASAVAIRAWDELQRRMQASALGPSQDARLTEVALAEQARATAGPIGQPLMEYLATRAAEGELTKAQKERFVDQGAKYTLEVRERIAKGDPVYYRIARAGRGPRRDWYGTSKVREIRIDGTPIRQRGFGSSGSSFGGNGAMASGFEFDEPGEHRMEVEMDETVRHGRGASSDTGAVFLTRIITLKSGFTILADPPADLVTMRPDEAARAVLLAKIKVVKAVLPPDSKHLHVSIDCEKLPVNIAFEVIGRFGEEELPLGTMTLPAGRQMGFGTGGDVAKIVKKLGRPGRITVILRSSDQAARRSIEIYQAWAGELVFEDVVVDEKR